MTANTGIRALLTQRDVPVDKQGLWAGQPAVGCVDVWLVLMMSHAEEFTDWH